MKYQFPIRIPQGWKLTVTQPFKSKDMISFYQARGMNIPYHDGVDIATDTPEHTFGLACIWPFPFQGKVWHAAVDAPMEAKKNAHSQIDGIDPLTGITYSIIYLHLTEVSKGSIFNQGDTIGWIGNNGAVSPVPTPTAPFNGSHLHLGLSTKQRPDMNYTLVDPLEYFDINNPFRGTDDITKDKPAYDWAYLNGTVQPPPRFYFDRNLWFGMKNNDVLELQKRLGIYPQTGFFGVITLKNVVEYQKTNGITPAYGFVGNLTRISLNS